MQHKELLAKAYELLTTVNCSVLEEVIRIASCEYLPNEILPRFLLGTQIYEFDGKQFVKGGIQDPSKGEEEILQIPNDLLLSNNSVYLVANYDTCEYEFWNSKESKILQRIPWKKDSIIVRQINTISFIEFKRKSSYSLDYKIYTLKDEKLEIEENTVDLLRGLITISNIEVIDGNTLVISKQYQDLVLDLKEKKFEVIREGSNGCGNIPLRISSNSFLLYITDNEFLDYYKFNGLNWELIQEINSSPEFPLLLLPSRDQIRKFSSLLPVELPEVLKDSVAEFFISFS